MVFGTSNIGIGKWAARIYAFVAMFMVAMPMAAKAQSLVATPIAIDIADNGPAAEPILIAAYQPISGVAPVLVPGGGNTQLSAVAFDATKPRPSIILGRVEAGQEDAFGIERLLPATVAEIRFDYDDLAARAALRARDPELFRQLVEQGHVDPPETVLKAALQTELSRMNCYRSRVDNAWGPGSRRSVSAYFNEIDGVDWPDQEPSTGLFRTILLRGDVACPAPVIQAPRQTTTSARRTTPRRTTKPAAKPRRTTTAVKRPAPVSKPKPTSKPKISGGGGIGVFR